MSEQKDLERARVVDAMCMTWRHDFGLDKRADEIGSCGMTDGERYALRRQMGQLYDHHISPLMHARSLPVGVPDVSELQRLLDDVRDVRNADDVAFGWHEAVERICAPAAPTVKAEQVPTPEFVWVRLLEALAGDNGCPFTASTDDYREAKPALIQLIEAGFFRDDADSLDGDIWTVAAGEQGEAAARFASCAESYAALSDVLNRVFERPEEAPSLPAAGSAVEEVHHFKAQVLELIVDECRYWQGKDEARRGGFAILYAKVNELCAQQSATERVSVLCEALEDARRAMFAVLNQEPRMKAVAKRVLNAEIGRIDRALLASHAEGGKV